MSAHRTLNDIYRAFDTNGPGRLADPGDAGTITPTMWGQFCMITTAAAETRTLAQPSKPGIRFALILKTYAVGACTVTVTGGYNRGGETSLVLGASGVAGDVAEFVSVQVGTSFYWRLLTADGVATSRSFYQPAITVVADGVSTPITAAELKTGLLVTTSSTAARAPTVPTGTAINAIIPIGDAFDWSFLNIGNQTVTITQATGHTLVGTMTLATVTSGLFRTKCTAANTAITYRLCT